MGIAICWQGAIVEINEFIVRTPGTCGGRARVAGRRVPVSSIYRWFLSGLSPEDILPKYEGLILAEVYAAIAHALANPDEVRADIEEEDRLDRMSRKVPSPAPSL